MSSLQELVANGKKYFENKEYLKAENCFRKVLSQEPSYADILNLMGVIHNIEGKFDSAIGFFEKALKKNPNYTEALLNLAVMYNDLGKYDSAKKLYSQLHKRQEKLKHKHIEPVLKGRLSNLHADIGDIYCGLSLFEHAIDEYKKALLLNPHFVDIKTRLGVAYRENKQLKESLAELIDAAKLDPRYITAHIQLGVTYYSLGKLADAKKEWNKVLEKDTGNEYAKMYLKLCK